MLLASTFVPWPSAEGTGRGRWTNGRSEAHPLEDVAGTLRSSLDARSIGPDDPRLRTTWRVLTGSFGLLGLAGLAAVAGEPG